MISIKRKTLGDAWEQTIRELLYSSEQYIYSSTEGPCYEIASMVIEVTDPDSEPRVSPLYDFPSDLIENYAKLTSGRTTDVEAVYDRIHRWGTSRRPINQLEAVLRRLRDAPTTRTAIISIWDPSKDLDAAHPMTICTLAFHLINHRLHLTVTMRSNDAWFALPVDMKALTDLQIGMAQQLGVSVGSYLHHSFRCHIYAFDVPRAMNKIPSL